MMKIKEPEITNNTCMPRENTSSARRALVLQGGGALGAYQVGAINALLERIYKKDNEDNSNSRPFFDIIAGTSIGAINAAILVSSFKENNKSCVCCIKKP